MLKIIKTKKSNKDLNALIKKLDQYLKKMDGEDHEFYNQFNHLDCIHHFVVAYKDKTPIGCGAFRKIDNKTVEIKRMYVKNEFRRKGVAKEILLFLENWAQQENFTKGILETGNRQKAAIQLYEKTGYQKIPNYGQYTQMENSNCFEKHLR